MVVAAGDHRDDTSGVTAALDPADEREHHEGNGHDPLPVPADAAAPEPTTSALPAVPGDEQPALERGAEAAPPSGDVDDRRELPAARPPAAPSAWQRHPPRGGRTGVDGLVATRGGRPARPRPSVRHRHRPCTP